MKIEDQNLKDILLKGNYVTPENIIKAETFAKKNEISLREALVKDGIIAKNILGQAIAEFLHTPYADLSTNQPPKEQILKIPQVIAEKYRAVFFREDNKDVVIATDNPEHNDVISQVQSVFPGKKITLAYSLPEDVEEAFINYRQNLETRFIKIIKEQKQVAPGIIEEILEDALAYHASDIHFEPMEKDVNVRFRIDGVLWEMGKIPKDYYGNILNRIKVQAHLRIDEHFSAQDGAIRYIRQNKAIDLRISIVPTLDGEKIAIRILAEYVRGFTLADLGLSDADQKLVLNSAHRPFGMILVTGPTGSGKTTTLYSLIKILNRPEVHIMTIEDPVEYKILGINQIQVNRQTDLTFSKGLPSILRQDPDVILVGEIRGPDTATIAVNAALTGHLLLSTFHANNAATTIPRLIDMGVEPFLIASTLELIIAQRLVRKICENCRLSVSFEEEQLKKIVPNVNNYFQKFPATLYRGKGCDLCAGTGYKGRTAIFEFIPATKEIQDLILQEPSSKQIIEIFRRQGNHSLFADGLEKAKQGVTSLEELLRVASPYD